MDKQKAQFILHSFRPDGSDAADRDFAEALQLAVEDNELGEWLVKERSSDAAFAAALCDVEIPDELRMHILAVMRGQKPSDPAQEAEMDAILSDALSHVEPPEGLRSQILAAMQVQQSQVATPAEILEKESDAKPVLPHVADFSSKKTGITWLRVTSLAAAVVFGIFFAFQIDLGSEQNPSVAELNNPGLKSARVLSADLQSEAAHMLNDKLTMDVMHPKKTQVNVWLANHQLPAPARLPAGLREMKVMGCKKIQLAGDKTASLLCFIKGTGGMVHMIVINNDYIKDAHLPSMNEVTTSDCYHCPETGWNMTRWRDRENTFLLFAKKETTSQDELIRYF